MEAGLNSWPKPNCSQDKPFQGHEQVLALDEETQVGCYSAPPLHRSCWAPRTSAGMGAGIILSFTLSEIRDNVKLCVKQDTTQMGRG